jgi:hypothetical protein
MQDLNLLKIVPESIREGLGSANEDAGNSAGYCIR